MASWLLELVGAAGGIWYSQDSRAMKDIWLLLHVGMMVLLLTNVGGTVGASCRSGVGLITGMVLYKQVFLAGLMSELVEGTVGLWCRWAVGSVGALILTFISCTVLFVMEFV